MHNARILTNPMHPITKMTKQLTAKRKKTDDDLMAISKIEWVAGLYLSKPPTVEIIDTNVAIKCDGRIVVPGEVLEAVLREGAKQNRLGTTFKAGVQVLGDSLLDYDGPSDLEKLWAAGNFTDIRNVRVQRAAILRTRPIFTDWALTFDIEYLPQVVDLGQIKEALTIGGQRIALCDYRPKYGKFCVKEFG